MSVFDKAPCAPSRVVVLYLPIHCHYQPPPLGRELNKEQIRDIINNTPKDLTTEIFVDGAICFGYSGRCFLSDFLCGRSANLGDCAQSCRWAYNVYVE